MFGKGVMDKGEVGKKDMGKEDLWVGKRGRR